MKKSKILSRAALSVLAVFLASGSLVSYGTSSTTCVDEPKQTVCINSTYESSTNPLSGKTVSENKIFAYGNTVESAIASLSNSKLYDKNGTEKIGGVLCSGDVLIENSNSSTEKCYTVIVKGDTNGDGIVNAKDVITAKLSLASSNILLYTSAADENSDGVVTQDEINYIAETISTLPAIPTPPSDIYTVIFKDWDDRVIRIHSDISSGEDALAPDDPIRDGYIFIGWDISFTDVTENLTVTAEYTQITEPTVYVSNAYASAGETVQVTVNIANNPGIAGAKLKLTYHEGLTLADATLGDAFAVLDYIAPAALKNNCFFNWDSLMQQSNSDGTVLVLTFTVCDSAVAGAVYNIDVTYTAGDVYDTNLEDVTLNTVSGTIKIN